MLLVLVIKYVISIGPIFLEVDTEIQWVPSNQQYFIINAFLSKMIFVLKP